MRQICLHMIFLHYKLPCPPPPPPRKLIKDKLMDLIERIFQRGGSLILHVMIGMLLSPQMQLEIIIYGLVRKYVKLSPFF